MQPVTGVIAEEHEGLVVLWIGTAHDGRPRAAVVAVTADDWLALEEVVLPPHARELAAELIPRVEAQVPPVRR